MRLLSHPAVVFVLGTVVGATVAHGFISGLPGVNKLPQK
jgi:hypothetical protein